MEEPKMTVTEIRRKILSEKEDKPKKELTEKQKENQERLIRANESFLEAVEQAIYDGIEAAFTADDYARSTFIFSPEEEADLEGLSWMTIAIGYYNKEKKFYTRKPHHSAGIMRPPLEVLKDKMRPLGVTDIVNISDKSKGYKLVIRVEFTYDE